MDPLPYNVTISSQTASVLYSPDRDTTPDRGWNITYSHGATSTPYGPTGVGADYHRTSVSGATMQLSWVGTALYLYGNAAPGSYKIAVDNIELSELAADLQVGLLGSKTGLSYGSHTATLTVVGGSEVAFQYAEVTIGVGYQGSSFPIQNQSVPLVIADGNSAKPNEQFFSFNKAAGGSSQDCSWYVEGFTGQTFPANGSPESVPRQMVASCGGDSLVFKIKGTSAFFIWGVVYNDHHWKTATLKPGLDGAPSKTTHYRDFSSTLDFRQILYWESGLDRDEEYEVEIMSDYDSGKNFMSFHTLQLIDGGSKPNVSELSPSGSPPSSQSSTGLGAGPIAGIAIGVVSAIVLVLLASYLLWRRRPIRRKAVELDQETSNVPEPFTDSPASFSPREIDAGPVIPTALPPEYNPSWSDSVESVQSPSQRSLPIPPGSTKQELFRLSWNRRRQ
ncbi:hypothetical protein Moror_13492 [Moniliophthora roreri MCA 2997]|uniref:Uncharacterized protein n=1 Tax=Moniliophthora roreri (strain MCA 2997) TaxID=1381753 RepID=V2XWR7_MONRO|nr:hypothetical protein Moror_13492 [Moniliophthora roreri MCA 2997]